VASVALSNVYDSVSKEWVACCLGMTGGLGLDVHIKLLGHEELDRVIG
jgi:hypothetical protein